MKKLHLITLAIVSSTATVFAGGTPSLDKSVVAPEPTPCYSAGEWQFGIFGAYSFTNDSNRAVLGEDSWGGGIELNYFPTVNFGIGIEGSLYDTDGDNLGNAAVNLIYRFPCQKTCLAAYVFGGGGVLFNADNLDSGDFEDAGDRVRNDDRARNSDDVLFEGHAGLGLEYRFTPRYGIFTDIRYTWVESSDSDFATARAGFRVQF
jgi:Outer membrane protein beta-barrel domain